MSKARVERNIYRGPAKPELGGVSLVFPVRNESFMIEMTLRNYSSELQPRIADFELIVAEDAAPMTRRAFWSGWKRSCRFVFLPATT
jgi:hypothetical protein